MPAIFHKLDGRWEAERISGARGVLSLSPVRFEAVPDADADARDVAGCLLARLAAVEAWVAILGDEQQLLHNGRPVTTAIRVLAHMDSLSLPGQAPVYFSTEETARIEPFAGAAKATCPRCRSDILPGQPGVKCPRCGVFHHEIEDRNCWTYSKTCTLCAQPTALDTGLQWTPETL